MTTGFTAKNFIAQGMAKSTIYRIMKRYEQEGSVVRATGSGRRATKITREKIAQLRRSVDHKTGIFQKSLAVLRDIYFENEQKIENSLFQAHQSAQI